MARELSRQFKQHTVEKTYYALVRGGESSFSAQQGTIDNPVEVSTNGRASLGTLSGDKKSRTRWELLGSSRYAKNGRQFRLGIQAPLPHDFVQFCNHSGLELDSDIAKPIAFIDGEPSPGGEIHELNGHLLSELH
ncbi:pseudouridine family [Moniliophthora roreri]|nr:pseudouridine family [Moniliophthora roreri]